MRQFLAVAFVGATLAFGATAALAGENRDPMFQPQPAASVSIASPTGSSASIVAGDNASTSVYPQLGEDNWGHREQ